MDDISPDHAVLGHHLKFWADHNGFVGESKASACYPKYEWFIVTSQYTIDQVFPEEETRKALHRRFHVISFIDGNGKLPALHSQDFNSEYHRAITERLQTGFQRSLSLRKTKRDSNEAQRISSMRYMYHS